jgi:hypothetical protein
MFRGTQASERQCSHIGQLARPWPFYAKKPPFPSLQEIGFSTLLPEGLFQPLVDCSGNCCGGRVLDEWISLGRETMIDLECLVSGINSALEEHEDLVYARGGPCF